MATVDCTIELWLNLILGHPVLYYSSSQPRYSDHPDIREINLSNRCFLHSIDCEKQQGNKYFTIDIDWSKKVSFFLITCKSLFILLQINIGLNECSIY